jgi:hypothetical protein
VTTTEERRSELLGRVERLATMIDVPIADRPPTQLVALGLALRVGELYRSIRHAGTADGTAAAIVLRTMVETTIVLRWFEDDPVNRIRIWLAEDDRERLTVADRTQTLHARRGREPLEVFTRQEVAAMKASIAAARRLPGARQVRGGASDSGSLLPPLEQIVRGIPDLWEAYEVAYRALSAVTHTAGRSLASHEIEQRPDGTHLVALPAWSIDATEALAGVVACVAIASVSRQAILGLEAIAQEIQVELTTWDDDPAGNS